MKVYGMEVAIEKDCIRVENLNKRVFYSDKTRQGLVETLSGLLNEEYTKKAATRIMRAIK